MNAVMRKLIAGVAILAVTLAAATGTSIPTQAATAATAYTYQTNAVFLTNARRQTAGIHTLRIDWRLTLAAQRHSNYQASIHTMTHVGADGSHGGTRITRAGLVWNSWGENVAAGQTSATQVVNDWMASPTHRANMLNAGFTMIGVGLTVDTRGVWYWTLEFAS